MVDGSREDLYYPASDVPLRSMKMTGDVLSYLTVFNIGSSLCRRGACGFCLFPKVIRW